MREKKVRAHAVESGRVQGVFFRVETKKAADHFTVFGWVKNRSDGKVEAVFEGNAESVDAVIKWCYQGPSLSRVDNVDVIWEDTPEGFDEFRITY